MTPTQTYLGVIERGAENFGIVFPDFPGCVSVGDTIDEVLTMGQEALSLHIEGMVEDGETIPGPSEVSVEQARRDFPEAEWIAIGAVRVEIPAFPKTVAVALKSELVRKIVEESQRTASHITAQKFVENAVLRELERSKKSA